MEEGGRRAPGRRHQGSADHEGHPERVRHDIQRRLRAHHRVVLRLQESRQLRHRMLPRERPYARKGRKARRRQESRRRFRRRFRGRQERLQRAPGGGRWPPIRSCT